MKFSPEYVENVLKQNFEDSRELFFEYLLDIHFAHLIMLHKIDFLEEEEARRLAASLTEIEEKGVQSVVYDGTFEDLFFYVEHLLTEACGPDLAGKLHTARSRNDIDTTLYRLRWREEVFQLARGTQELRATLLGLCRREKETLLPLYTHAQAAQPSTVAHYFLGIVESLERDHLRFSSALERINRSPLGSCAITGTSYPIDRELTARLLGFDGPTGNTHASIASVDYLLEPVGAGMVMVTTLGKMVQDLLLWSTTEFRFFRLGDAFVQPSSIMPQKRNPVSLEHSRALFSRALGQGQALFTMLHNTPFGDIVDVEDDLQPLVNRFFLDTRRPLALVGAALETARFDRERTLRKANSDWITATELADALVRDHDLPFRQAHGMVAAMIEQARRQPALSKVQALREASKKIAGREISYSEERIAELLNAEHFVSSHATFGGPAGAVVSAAIEESQKNLEEDKRLLIAREQQFLTYRKRLREKAGFPRRG